VSFHILNDVDTLGYIDGFLPKGNSAVSTRGRQQPIGRDRLQALEAAIIINT
jgi:hypothetical protein